jgi:hypothetical protein
MPSDLPSPVPPADPLRAGFTATPPDPGLPPVTPPSGRVMVRLFLVPALIVGGIVGVLLLLNWLLQRSHTPESFLKKLDDPNPEVRWRAASDLAQTLPRDPRLAGDADFALELARRLKRTLEASAGSERAFAAGLKDLPPDEAVRDRRKLEPGRNYVRFLCGSLGGFLVPVGVPLLSEVARDRPTDVEPVLVADRRQAALIALATLGQNLRRFDPPMRQADDRQRRLPDDQQQAIVDSLEVAGGDSASSAWARAALDHLRKRRAGTPDAFGIDGVIADCAADPDPAIRYLAAYLGNFWSGDDGQDQRIEQALLKLAGDTGQGKDVLNDYAESHPERDPNLSRAVVRTRADGGVVVSVVSVNAAIALARRGSRQAPLDLLKTMLDESALGEVFVLRGKDGRETPDKAKAAQVILDTLKALRELHARQPGLDYRRFREPVEALAGAADRTLRTEAEKTRDELNRGG